MEKEDRSLEDVIKTMSVAKKDAKEKGFRTGNAGQGEVECLVCKGKLRYSVSAVNGHMWASCSTKDCVRWME